MHNGNSTTTRKSVEALAAELQAQGLDDLAADVTFGPISTAAHIQERNQQLAKHADADTTIDDDTGIEDVLDNDDDEADTDDDDDDEGDSFEEVLDEDEDDAEDDEEFVEAKSNPISAVILDPDRTYSKEELATLRTIANTCIANKHLVPNAKALLKSLDAYESQH